MQADRQAEDGRQQDHRYGRHHALGEPEADRVANPHDDQDREEHPHGVGDQAAGQHGRARHRHRPQPVDDALLQLLCQCDGRAEARERRGLADDPRHQVVDVPARHVHRDRAAEDVAEHQHEHHGLDHGEHDVGGHPKPDQQVAPGDGESVDRGPPGPEGQIRRGFKRGDGCHDALLFGESGLVPRSAPAAPALATWRAIFLGGMPGDGEEHVIE